MTNKNVAFFILFFLFSTQLFSFGPTLMGNHRKSKSHRQKKTDSDDLVIRCIESSCDLAEKITHSKLDMAIIENNVDMVSSIVSGWDDNEREELINKRNLYGYSPLHLAVEKKRLEIVKYLMRNFRYIIDINKRIKTLLGNGKTALQIAQKKKYKYLVKLLQSYGATN